MFTRVPTGRATIHVKVTDRLTGNETFQRVVASDEWTPVSIALPVQRPVDIGIEATPDAGVVYLDDAEVRAESTPSSVPLRRCGIDRFDTGVDGWAPWWGGTSIGAAEIERSDGPALIAVGGPAAIIRTILPADCPGLRAVRFDVGPALYRRIHVKTIDLATGEMTELGPTTMLGPHPWTPIDLDIPISVGAAGVQLAIESYPGRPALTIDNVEYLATDS